MNWSESSRGLIIAANESAERTRHLTRSVIIVRVDGSAEAEAVAAAVREAELWQNMTAGRHACCEVPILPPRSMAAAIAQGREESKALLDKVAGTLALPATTHLHQLIKRTPPSHCPGCRRKRTSRCSVMIIRRLAGHMPYRDLSAGRSTVQHAPLGIG